MVPVRCDSGKRCGSATRAHRRGGGALSRAHSFLGCCKRSDQRGRWASGRSAEITMVEPTRTSIPRYRLYLSREGRRPSDPTYNDYDLEQDSPKCEAKRGAV